MRTIYLIEGPVGAGKSTYAGLLSKELTAVHLSLDEWFTHLYSSDRPSNGFFQWYFERKERLLELMWKHALGLTESGISPILELGLIQRQARYAFYERAQVAEIDLRVHVLDASNETRWERVQKRNQEKGTTFSMFVSEQVFELASKLWEAPDDIEICDYQINVVSTA